MTWKGIMCKFFSMGACTRGINCAFAHGAGDIRSPMPGMIRDLSTGHWTRVASGTEEKEPEAVEGVAENVAELSLTGTGFTK
jgi:hypothetical protein